MEKILQVVRLMAETGLFFANVDGIYQDRERRFIEDYVHGIEEIGDITPEEKQWVYGALDKKYSLDDIIRDTRRLLDGFEEIERQQILKSMKGFIKKVIKADGHVHPLEHANFLLWKQAFGVM